MDTMYKDTYNYRYTCTFYFEVHRMRSCDMYFSFLFLHSFSSSQSVARDCQTEEPLLLLEASQDKDR